MKDVERFADDVSVVLNDTRISAHFNDTTQITATSRTVELVIPVSLGVLGDELSVSIPTPVWLAVADALRDADE